MERRNRGSAIVVSNSVLVSAMMKQLDANADGKIERDEKN